MATLLDFESDIKGFNSFAAPFSDQKYSATLAAGGNASVTVPSGNYTKYIVAFSYAAASNVWVSVGGTAAGPAGATFASTTSQLLPGVLAVDAADVINIKNTGAGSADVGVVFYAIS